MKSWSRFCRVAACFLLCLLPGATGAVEPGAVSGNATLALDGKGAIRVEIPAPTQMQNWSLGMLVYLPAQADYREQLRDETLIALLSDGDGENAALDLGVRTQRQSRYVFCCSRTTARRWSGTSFRARGLVVADSWHHVLLVAVGRDLSLYLNGELLGTKFLPQIGDALQLHAIMAGRVGPGGGTGYRIDDVRLWQRALSPKEAELEAADQTAPGALVVLNFEDLSPEQTSGTQVLAEGEPTLVAERVRRSMKTVEPVAEAVGVRSGARLAEALESSRRPTPTDPTPKAAGPWQFAVPEFVTEEKSLQFVSAAKVKADFADPLRVDGLTLSLWLYVPTSEQLAIHFGNAFSLGVDISGADFLGLRGILHSSGKGAKLGLALYDGKEWERIGEPALRYGRWNHLALVIEPRRIAFFSNGQQHNSAGIEPFVKNLKLGNSLLLDRALAGFAHAEVAPWRGLALADLRLWRRALTEEEIRADLASAQEEMHPDLVSHVTFRSGRPEDSAIGSRVSLSGAGTYAVQDDEPRKFVDPVAEENRKMEEQNAAFVMEIPSWVRKRKSAVHTGTSPKYSSVSMGGLPVVGGVTFATWVWIPELELLQEIKTPTYQLFAAGISLKNTPTSSHSCALNISQDMINFNAGKDAIQIGVNNTEFRQTAGGECWIRFGEWNHFALSLVDQKALICINGKCMVLPFTKNEMKVLAVGDVNYWLSAHTGKKSGFAIHDVRLWRRALTAEELRSQMSEQPGKKDKDLLFYMDFHKGKPNPSVDDFRLSGWDFAQFGARK